MPTSLGIASCASVITTATTEPAWHRRLRAKRSQARTLVRLAVARHLLQVPPSAQQPPMSKNGAGASDKDDGWAVAPHRRNPKQQMVQCCKVGCKGACPLNVVLRASQVDGVPAKCLYEDLCERVVVSTPPAAARGAYTKQSAPGALKGPSGVYCSRTRARGGGVNRVNSRRW